MFQDGEELFNFVPSEIVRCTQRKLGLNANRKRPASDNDLLSQSSSLNYSFVKKASRGSKIIRIEIYDAKDFDNQEGALCKCKADLCVQHVVKNVIFDDIYKNVKDAVSKIQENIEAEL